MIFDFSDTVSAPVATEMFRNGLPMISTSFAGILESLQAIFRENNAADPRKSCLNQDFELYPVYRNPIGNTMDLYENANFSPPRYAIISAV